MLQAIACACPSMPQLCAMVLKETSKLHACMRELLRLTLPSKRLVQPNIKPLGIALVGIDREQETGHAPCHQPLSDLLNEHIVRWLYSINGRIQLPRDVDRAETASNMGAPSRQRYGGYVCSISLRLRPVQRNSAMGRNHERRQLSALQYMPCVDLPSFAGQYRPSSRSPPPRKPSPVRYRP